VFTPARACTDAVGTCNNGVNTAIYKALGQANIEIPFPQRVVTMAGAPAEPTPPS
jgi:small-conductance mechanosensitive channel